MTLSNYLTYLIVSLLTIFYIIPEFTSSYYSPSYREITEGGFSNVLQNKSDIRTIDILIERNLDYALITLVTEYQNDTLFNSTEDKTSNNYEYYSARDDTHNNVNDVNDVHVSESNKDKTNDDSHDNSYVDVSSTPESISSSYWNGFIHYLNIVDFLNISDSLMVFFEELEAEEDNKINNVNDTNDTNLSNNTRIFTRYEFYKINFERQGSSEFVKRFKNMTTLPVEVKYYDKPPSIWSVLGIGSIIPFFILMFFLRVLNYLSGSSDVESLLDRKMDVQEVKQDMAFKFSDVAGMAEAKSEIVKFVDILKFREKYKEMGAKIPRGILLCGPPGCGKTLLAKAVAGEAKVNFLSTCGSDFDEIFVGSGSSRVKKLFESARAKAPCVIYIDEIDSIGEKRSNYFGSRGSDTINKILSEMDGFKDSENIMVMASTNREDRLDEALLRSGRFDSKIYIEPPNKKERIEMFKLYLGRIKLMPEINVEEFACKLADMTPTMTGADVANILNQAAITATYEKQEFITEDNIVSAIDDVAIGIEKKSRKVKNEELKITAYHESGHALVGYLLKDSQSPVKVSIMPRGKGNLGYTQPKLGENNIMTESQYLSQIMMMLGGRAAEMLIFGNKTSGASDDFNKANSLMMTMITKFTMCDEDNDAVVYELDRGSKTYVSDQRRYELENLCKDKVNSIYDEVYQILSKNKEKLETLAASLLDKERLSITEIRKIVDGENEIDPFAKEINA